MRWVVVRVYSTTASTLGEHFSVTFVVEEDLRDFCHVSIKYLSVCLQQPNMCTRDLPDIASAEYHVFFTIWMIFTSADVIHTETNSRWICKRNNLIRNLLQLSYNSLENHKLKSRMEVKSILLIIYMYSKNEKYISYFKYKYLSR